MKLRRALFSLTDKRGAVEFAAGLRGLGCEILSTGNTARTLREAGVVVIDVAAFTGFPEILEGRLKTLHPRIHGGLLGRRGVPRHAAEMAEHGIDGIDLVAVNLYPFERVSREDGAALAEVVENIDIGGPALIRSAAKNHEDVAVVVDPDDYPALLAELRAGGGTLAPATLRRLARRAFERTAAYDVAIAAWLGAREEFGGGGAAGGAAPLDGGFLRFGVGRRLRYGENPHQGAVFLPLAGAAAPSVSTARQLAGKELSFNNIVDLDAALQLARELPEAAAVVVKHTNPCGAGLGSGAAEAFARALDGDRVAAFGGIVAYNVEVDEAAAAAMTAPGTFFECVIAPRFDAGAVAILTGRPKWGKSVRLLAAGRGGDDLAEHDVRKVRGGLLVQEQDRAGPEDRFAVAAGAPLAAARQRTARLAWVTAKHAKSNAIVLARDERIVGVGAGQMSRVDAVEIAVRKAGERARGAVLASDAFFPFRDGIDVAARAGVDVVIQPGGSVRDDECRAAALEHGMTMLLTGTRHFRH